MPPKRSNDAGKRVVVDFAGCGDDAEMVRNFSQKHPFVRFGGHLTTQNPTRISFLVLT